MSQIRVSAFYQFVPMGNVDALQAPLLTCAQAGGVKGTVLLAHEGVNGTIAGPEGGTDLKPIGTVAFARSLRDNDEVNAEERLLDGSSRAAVRHQAALVALELLLP